MTFICSSDDVDKLIREMRYWGDDPDIRRIADAIPLDVLEAAYVAKLDQLPPEPLPWLAVTVRDKILVLRRIFAVWVRARSSRTLGELFVNGFISADELWDDDNEKLVKRLEIAYTPK